MNGLLTITRVATPAEQADNKRLIREIIAARTPDYTGKEWRVTLDHDNVLSQEEYPDRWVGIEIEREGDLVCLRFPKVFRGKSEKGQGETKTKKRGQHLYTMWVPKWLLRDFSKEVTLVV